jgi:putative N-acetylmannosamine-6-phosphate epimerase
MTGLFEKPGVIVSCQARTDNPLHGPAFMTAMARAAALGGACGVRAEGESDIVAIRASVDLPIIGLRKRRSADFEVYITPGFKDARLVAEAGADVIAVDATPRPRDGEALKRLVTRIKKELGKPVMADVSTLEEGINAEKIGCDFVATTLSGYTGYSRHTAEGPDLALVDGLVEALDVPVIAEGRIWRPEEVERAFEWGARAVVIGTAITNPMEITRRFVRAVPHRA